MRFGVMDKPSLNMIKTLRQAQLYPASASIRHHRADHPETGSLLCRCGRQTL